MGHWPPRGTQCCSVTLDRGHRSSSNSDYPQCSGAQRLLLSQGCGPERGLASRVPRTGKGGALPLGSRLGKPSPLWASDPPSDPPYDTGPFDTEIESERFQAPSPLSSLLRKTQQTLKSDSACLKATPLTSKHLLFPLQVF